MFDLNQVQDEKESYLLGFLYADGSVCNFQCGAYRTLIISLQEKDKDFLQKICDIFNEELNKSYFLKYQAKTKSYKLAISDGKTIQNLIQLGIIHRKSYENNSFVFDNVPDELKNHFIRGYFDGDGSIGCYGYKENQSSSLFGNIVSCNEKLLISIQDFLLKQDIKISFKIEKDKYFRLTFGGNRIREKIRNFLYRDCSICMERKKEIFFSKNPLPRQKYIGITQRHNRFFVVINYGGKHHTVGTFDTVLEAVNAYNIEAKKHNKQIQNYKGESLI